MTILQKIKSQIEALKNRVRYVTRAENIALAKSIILSLDFLAGVFFALLVYVFFPENISNSFAKDIYSIGISVLSIIFSVYFAALSIIISSSDDSFVEFLEDLGKYQIIIFVFRFSLIVLFIALLISIFMYAGTSMLIEMKFQTQNKIVFVIFTLVFFYGLFTALTSTLDSIKYASTRSKYIKTIKKKDSKNRSNNS